jgi:hypothetical protein
MAKKKVFIYLLLMIIHFAQQDVIPTEQEDFFPACSEAGLLMPLKTKHFIGPLQNGLVSAGGGAILLCLNKPF